MLYLGTLLKFWMWDIVQKAKPRRSSRVIFFMAHDAGPGNTITLTDSRRANFAASSRKICEGVDIFCRKSEGESGQVVHSRSSSTA